MKTRMLGSGNLEVSEIGLGYMGMSWSHGPTHLPGCWLRNLGSYRSPEQRSWTVWKKTSVRPMWN